jgi:hypothetical protein
MFRVVACALLGFAAAAAALLLVVSAAFMPTVAEEPIYEATGD